MAKKKQPLINVDELPVVHEVFSEKIDVIYIHTEDEVTKYKEQYYKHIDDTKVVMADTETSGLDTFTDMVSIVQIAPNPEVVYVIDVLELGEKGWDLVTYGFKDKTVKFWNADFDVRMMRRYYKDEPWKVVIDLMILSQTYYQGKKSVKHSLQASVKKHLDLWLAKDEQASDWVQRPLTLKQITYGACDVAVMWPLDKVLVSKIKSKDHVYKAVQIDIRFQPALWDAERAGMPLNLDRANQVKKEFELELITLEDDIKRALDTTKDFNIRSHKQLKPALSRYVGQELDGTGDSILAHFDRPEFEAIGKIRQYRTSKKLGEYVDKLVSLVRNVDPNTGFGTVNTKYWPFGTVVGRISSSKPNLQNPSRDSRIRSLFEAPPGYKILGCDWSAAHGRIVASSKMSNDPELQDIFNNDDDWYIRTAQSIVASEGMNWDSLSKKEQKDWRQRTKAVCLGFLFGMYPDKFVIYAKSTFGLDYTEAEALKFRNAFFSQYKGLVSFHKRLKNSGYNNRRSYTLGGHEIYHEIQKVTDFLNWCVIGTEADIFKVAAHRLRKEIVIPSKYEINIINFIHDEFLFLIPDSEVDAICHEGNPLFDAGKKGKFFLSKDGEERLWVESGDKIRPEKIKAEDNLDAVPMLTSSIASEVQGIMVGAFNALVPDVKAKADPSIGQSWADAK